MQKIQFSPVKHLLPALALSLAITSCGSETESNTADEQIKPPAVENSVQALSGIASAKLNTPSTVDLSSYILGQTKGISLKVENMDKNHCPEPVISKLSFKITPTQLARCDYQYHLYQNGSYQASSTMEVLVSKAKIEAYLSPLAFASTVGDEGDIIFDWDQIKQLLSGYYWIDENKVKMHTLQGTDEGVIHLIYGLVLVNPWPIEFINAPILFKFDSPNTPGWNYISYEVTNGKLGEEKFGYLFISIADKANQAPIVPEQVEYSGTSIYTNNEAHISIKDFVTENDEDNWFLDSVIAMSADVAVVSKDAFSFKADEAGTHYVTFMVRDEHNAFSLSTMKIVVKNTLRNWHEVVVNSNQAGLIRLTAPSTKQSIEDVNKHKHFVEELTEKNRFEVPVWTLEEAQHHCQSQGYQLPDKDQFLALMKDTHANRYWPNDIAYWVYDNDKGNYRTMMLETNAKTNTTNDDLFAYLTCVDYHPTFATNN